MARRLIKAANSLISFVLVLCLLIAGAYAAYALWDNEQVYAAAENVQKDMLSLKGEEEQQDPAELFESLRQINPDVCAWVTLDNTAIDYPVLQGKTNLDYINTDVYGDFSLAGSIFLDAHNDPDFRDAYSLLYGHHMVDSLMFGDLDLYKDQAFFDENTTGTLILPDRTIPLEIFACVLAPSNDKYIFEPASQHELGPLLDHVRRNALFLHPETLQKLADGEYSQVLAFSTCSAEYTDARTIVLAAMTPPEISGGEG